MAELRAILFDFGGTLDADGVAWPQRFFPIYQELGIRADWDSFLEAFYASDDTLPRRHRLDGLDLQRTIELQVEQVLAVLAPEHRDLTKAIANRFVADSRLHFARNRPFLERLKTRYRLGIVSNFYGHLPGLLAAEGLTLFDAVADSSAVGSVKPAAGIFHHALLPLGVGPEEALMVGDSLSRDIRGAEALGMRHAWIDPSGAPACCPAGVKLRGLLDIEAVLEGEPAGATGGRA